MLGAIAAGGSARPILLCSVERHPPFFLRYAGVWLQGDASIPFLAACWARITEGASILGVFIIGALAIFGFIFTPVVFLPFLSRQVPTLIETWHSLQE